MSIYETSITNPKKQLEFYKQLSEQLQQENEKLKADYGTKVQVERDLLQQENKQLKEVIDKINLKIADYLESNYSIYAENEIEIDLINEIDNLLKEALNET